MIEKANLKKVAIVLGFMLFIVLFMVCSLFLRKLYSFAFPPPPLLPNPFCSENDLPELTNAELVENYVDLGFMVEYEKILLTRSRVDSSGEFNPLDIKNTFNIYLFKLLDSYGKNWNNKNKAKFVKVVDHVILKYKEDFYPIISNLRSLILQEKLSKSDIKVLRNMLIVKIPLMIENEIKNYYLIEENAEKIYYRINTFKEDITLMDRLKLFRTLNNDDCYAGSLNKIQTDFNNGEYDIVWDLSRELIKKTNKRGDLISIYLRLLSYLK